MSLKKMSKLTLTFTSILFISAVFLGFYTWTRWLLMIEAGIFLTIVCSKLEKNFYWTVWACYVFTGYLLNVIKDFGSLAIYDVNLACCVVIFVFCMLPSMVLFTWDQVLRILNQEE